MFDEGSEETGVDLAGGEGGVEGEAGGAHFFLSRVQICLRVLFGISKYARNFERDRRQEALASQWVGQDFPANETVPG
ncbi:hypothetical protein GCM10022403_064300 [Streptomyces coacervatus]|uniref:Uncharacterized protein n=1 Tax=Streptomyces coacervatus TaxID=647381 RepID=A0ABP7IM30_9ACTN